MLIVRIGFVMACLALSVPFVLHQAIRMIEHKTGNRLKYNHLAWSVSPVIWKRYREERRVFLQYCPLRYIYTWTVIHAVFLTVTVSVSILLQLLTYLQIR